jgi:DNA-binding MarR family transcriptional regulator
MRPIFLWSGNIQFACGTLILCVRLLDSIASLCTWQDAAPRHRAAPASSCESIEIFITYSVPIPPITVADVIVDFVTNNGKEDTMPEKDDFYLLDFLPYLLNQAAEESSLAFQKVYKGRYGMLRNEWRVLFHLGMYGRMTATEIGERSRIHKTKISRAVQKLAERRFLTRTRDDRDRRSEHLDLTPAGKTAYRDLHQVAEEYDARLEAHFTSGEVAILRVMLRRLAGIG